MPTREQKIEVIRKAAILANPSIMELKFGCELSRVNYLGDKDLGRKYKVIEDIGWGANTEKVWINSVAFGAMPIELKKDLIENGGEFEIIGRPVCLADVLLAMEAKSKSGEYCTNDPMSYVVCPIGGFWDDNGNMDSTWNLRTDDLDSQTDQCLSSLYELVK